MFVKVMRREDGLPSEDLKPLINPLRGLVRRKNNHQNYGQAKQHGVQVLSGEDLIPHPPNPH
jgi:hypothetical protein